MNDKTMLFVEFRRALDELRGAGQALHDELAGAPSGRRPACEPMLVRAFCHQGLREGPGSANDPTILRAFELAGAPWIKQDRTPWCAAFMCMVAAEAGVPYIKTVRAKKWLEWGEPADELDVLPGDVVVLDRGNGGGHVGLYIREVGGAIEVLGGNQDDQVCIKPYPSHRVLGFRRGWVGDESEVA